jgi:hypothetical protein
MIIILQPAYTNDIYNIIRGTEYSFPLTIYSNDSLLNLTNYSATFVIKDSDNVLLTLTGGNGLTLGGTAGTITVRITATTTSTLDVGTAYWTLMLTTNSIPMRYAEGPIKIRR